MIINYERLKNELIEFLENNKMMVLATSNKDKVSARMMSFVNIGTKLLFQTDKKLLKYKQIQKNKNVAIAIGNIQIEGLSKLKRHPFNEENSKFLELYKKYHYASFEAYSHLKDNRVIVVEPSLVKFWKYINAKPYIETLDLVEKKAFREEYKI